MANKYKFNPATDVKWTDLGLPSGTLWAARPVEQFMTFADAQEAFGENLPSEAQTSELIKNCRFTRAANGISVMGPNGNMIYLPVLGYRKRRALITFNYIGKGHEMLWCGTLRSGRGQALFTSKDSATLIRDEATMLCPVLPCRKPDPSPAEKPAPAATSKKQERNQKQQPPAPPRQRTAPAPARTMSDLGEVLSAALREKQQKEAADAAKETPSGDILVPPQEPVVPSLFPKAEEPVKKAPGEPSSPEVKESSAGTPEPLPVTKKDMGRKVAVATPKAKPFNEYTLKDWMPYFKDIHFLTRGFGFEYDGTESRLMEKFGEPKMTIVRWMRGKGALVQKVKEVDGKEMHRLCWVSDMEPTPVFIQLFMKDTYKKDETRKPADTPQQSVPEQKPEPAETAEAKEKPAAAEKSEARPAAPAAPGLPDNEKLLSAWKGLADEYDTMPRLREYILSTEPEIERFPLHNLVRLICLTANETQKSWMAARYQAPFAEKIAAVVNIPCDRVNVLFTVKTPTELEVLKAWADTPYAAMTELPAVKINDGAIEISPAFRDRNEYGSFLKTQLPLARTRLTLILKHPVSITPSLLPAMNSENDPPAGEAEPTAPEPRPEPQKRPLEFFTDKELRDELEARGWKPVGRELHQISVAKMYNRN